MVSRIKLLLLVSLVSTLCATALVAQSALTVTTAGVAYPGATVQVSVTLSGAAGQNIGGIGFNVPATSASLVPGGASIAATKTLWANASSVLLVGFTNPAPPSVGFPTNNAFADGAVLTFNYPIPASAIVGSTINLSLANPLAASATGAVALTSPPLVLTVGTNPACLTAVNTHIAAYLATPTIALLGQIVGELATAASTGSCQ